MDRTLCVVTTPLHILNSIELIYAKKVHLVDLVIIQNSDNSTKLYDFCKANLASIFDRVFLIKGLQKAIRNRGAETLLNIFKAKIKIRKLLRASEYTLLILGDSSDAAPIMDYLKKQTGSKSYILDDGAKTLNFLRDESLRNKVVHNKTKTLSKKWLMEYFFSGTIYYKFQSIYFSVYKDSLSKDCDINIINNDYHYYKTRLTHKDKFGLHLIGQPLYKSNLLGFDRYLKEIEKLSTSLDNELVYVAHPKEESWFLDIVRKKLSINIVRPECGYELYLLELPYLPEKIVLFYSSVVLFLSNVGLSPKEVFLIDVADHIKNEEKKRAAQSFTNYVLKEDMCTKLFQCKQKI